MNSLKYKLLGIVFFIFISVGIIYTVYYSVNYIENSKKIDVEAELNKLEEERIEASYIEDKVNEANIVLSRQELSGISSEENIEKKEINEMEINKYRTLAMSKLSEYRFLEACKSVSNLTVIYDLSNYPEFEEFVYNMVLVDAFYAFEDNDKIANLKDLTVPEIYAYAFFSLGTNAQYEVIYNKYSPMPHCVYPPIFKGVEEAGLREAEVMNFFRDSSKLKAYKVIFDTSNGEMFFYIVKDIETKKLSPIKFEYKDNKNMSSYEDFLNIYKED